MAKEGPAHPDLCEADLGGADLDGTNFYGADLSGADLEKASLVEADLRWADLRKADLRGADLEGADLGTANLSKVNLQEANLDGANLSEVNLKEANLDGVSLGGANLNGADLRGASLSEARVGATSFGDTNLQGAVGLDSCEHIGPSHLDYFTLAKSGLLPLSFLRGCGLPDQYIDYLPSLLNQAIQFYSCFISYSTKDQRFADRLHADLQNRGVRCWFAPHHIQGGRKIHEQLEEAIRIYDRLLLILSESSMSSRWVKTEIANARKKELEKNRRVLFPIRLVDLRAIRQWKLFDADAGDDSAREIREYFIPDFSNWKDHDSYQIAFERLLKDLKAEASR